MESQMPRLLKNETKVFSLDILQNGINRLATLAEFASKFDAELVKIAAEGFVNARRWHNDTTVTNQTNCARNARDVISAARAQVLPTELTSAILAYGHALQQFARCDYNGANLYVQQSTRLTRA
jgi:hypothetical protein